MSEPLKLLIVEDNEDDAWLIEAELRRRGCTVVSTRVESIEGVEAALAREPWDVILSDFALPTCDGLDVLRAVRQHDPDVPFLFVSGSIGEEVAVSAMRAGAHDYILKDNLTRLAPAVTREHRDAVDRREAAANRAARQALEEQLRQAQKMELVARLAGGVAHDFNNLLAVVILSADLARADAGPELQSLLNDIIHAAKDGAALTRQLSALGRRQALVATELQVNDVMHSQEPLLRRLAGERVVVTVELDESLGLVLADPTQIEQVILNLCVNARDAMPDGGHLTIRTSNIDLDEDLETVHGAVPAGHYVCLTVADTGVGMAPETQARVFEPFFSTKSEGKGTGLGLSVVHGIVTQGQGHIAVHSKPGAGTTFRVYLPRLDGIAEEVAAPAPSPGPSRGSEVVLLAEDEATLRRAASQALQQAGYVVLTVADGKEALALSRRHQGRIDLLISDVMMPGITGPELFAQLRQERPDLRVLFSSGYLPDHIAQQTTAAFEGRFLSKPFTMSELGARVRAVLDAPAPPAL